KKSEEEAEKRPEAATRKSEACRLADLEENELEKEDQAVLEKKSDEVKKQNRTVDEEEYERMVVLENKNRDDSFRRLKASFKNRIVLVCIE
ncbi:hypothetical protein DVH24_033452, partial [Malus domestica]